MVKVTQNKTHYLPYLTVQFSDTKYRLGWWLRDGRLSRQHPRQSWTFLVGTVFLAWSKAEAGRPAGGAGRPSCCTAHLSAVLSWGEAGGAFLCTNTSPSSQIFHFWTKTMSLRNTKSPPPFHPWPLASTNVKFQFTFTLWVGRTLHKYLKYKFLVFLCQNKDIWTVA